MTEITYRPIDQWPPGWRDDNRYTTRVPTPFRSTYTDTLQQLDDELYAHDASQAIIQVAGFTERDGLRVLRALRRRRV